MILHAPVSVLIPVLMSVETLLARENAPLVLRVVSLLARGNIVRGVPNAVLLPATDSSVSGLQVLRAVEKILGEEP